MKENNGSGMTVALKGQLEKAIRNGDGAVYVDPKMHHHVVIGRTGAGMSYFKQSSELSKLTIVLESYDENTIKEALEKNYLLDLKNLSEEDVKNVVEFVLVLKNKDIQKDGKYAKYFNMDEALRKKVITIDSFANAQKSIPKKQPDYRKFEKNKRY